MASSTGGGGVEKNVAIVYTIDGVDQAATDQDRLAGALGETSEALGEATEATTRAEQATERLSTASLEAGQQAILTQQRISALAAGLSGLGSALGSDTEVGSVLGRMGQLAATGVSIGSIFGPGGAVVGGILGAALPALQSLGEHLGIIGTAQDTAATAADSHAQALEGVASSAERASAQIQDLNRRLAERATAEQLTRIRGGSGDLTEQEQRMRAELLRERQRLADREGGTVAEIFGGSGDEAEILEALIANGQGSAGPRARRGGRGGGRRGPSAADRLDALMRGRGGDDAIGFAAGIGGTVDGQPSDFDVEIAGRRRPGGPGSGLRQGAAANAENAMREAADDKNKQRHEAQLARIQEEVDAWTTAGQKIGSTLYSAFQIAAAGQEDLDVAMVKGFKNLAIQFGGQMISEGIGALLTAVGMAGTLNPGAGAKAVEGAGKIALGVGLGAAGAAVQVPSPNASQASTPRLGPQGGESGKGGGSVVVNMNAPSVITGTRAQLGREIGRALRDSSQRFGRASP